MAEPRSLSVAKDNWLTDARAHNLIWLGRWLERAESVARGMDTAAKQALREGGGCDTLVDCLCDLASSLGVTVVRREEAAAELLLRNSGSSVLQSLLKARLSATQVAPVELMRALTEAVLEVQDLPIEDIETPQQIIDIATQVIGKIGSGSGNRRPVVRPRDPERGGDIPSLRAAATAAVVEVRHIQLTIRKDDSVSG